MVKVADMRVPSSSVKGILVELFSSMSEEEQAFLRSLAAETRGLLAEGKHAEAWTKCSQHLDPDEALALWSLFESYERTALTKAGNELRSR